MIFFIKFDFKIDMSLKCFISIFVHITAVFFIVQLQKTRYQVGMSMLLGWLRRLIRGYGRVIVEYSLIKSKLCVLFKSNNASATYTLS